MRKVFALLSLALMGRSSRRAPNVKMYDFNPNKSYLAIYPIAVVNPTSVNLVPCNLLRIA